MKEILNKIKEVTKQDPYSNGRNSMGAGENYYDPYYLTGKCFTEEELSNLSEKELQNLIKLAEFASEVFY